MKKIVFVTTTKPFNELFGFRQVNAITSWAKLDGIEKEIYVFTEDDITQNFDNDILKHITIIKEFEKSENSKIPTYRSLWNFGCDRSEQIGGYVCQINADIILTSSFANTINSILDKIGNKSFGAIGQRTDWNKPRPIDFSKSDWESSLKDEEKGNFKMHAPCGMDFILGNRKTLPELSVFYVARLNYDRWIVRQVIERNEFSIDMSKTAMAIHQDHGYGLDGSWGLNELLKEHKNEIAVNQDKDFYPVLNIDNSKHLTEIENGDIIVKPR